MSETSTIEALGGEKVEDFFADIIAKAQNEDRSITAQHNGLTLGGDVFEYTVTPRTTLSDVLQAAEGFMAEKQVPESYSAIIIANFGKKIAGIL